MGQKSEIDREEVRNILQVLKKNLQTFEEGQGTRNDFSMQADISTHHLGQYPAANGIVQSSQQAYGQIKGQYDSFLQSYQGIIDALERMVGNHEESEQQNTAASNQVGQDMNNRPAPNTQNTRPY